MLGYKVFRGEKCSSADISTHIFLVILAPTKFKVIPLPLCSFLISRYCKEVKKWTKWKRHKNESFSLELISTLFCLSMSNTYFQILVPKLAVASL